MSPNATDSPERGAAATNNNANSANPKAKVLTNAKASGAPIMLAQAASSIAAANAAAAAKGGKNAEKNDDATAADDVEATAPTTSRTQDTLPASIDSSTEPRPKNIVIVGGGIVGVCTAYFLAISPQRPQGSTITLVEGTGIASAASGNAGGFLARDWHGPATASEYGRVAG